MKDSLKEIIFISISSIIGIPFILLTLYFSISALADLFFGGNAKFTNLLFIASPIIFIILFSLLFIKIKKRVIPNEPSNNNPLKEDLSEVVSQPRTMKENIFLGIFFATLIISVVSFIFLIVNDSQTVEVLSTGAVSGVKSVLYSLGHNEFLSLIISLFYGGLFVLSNFISFNLFRKADKLWSKIYYFNTINLLLTLFYIFLAEDIMFLLLPIFSIFFIFEYLTILNKSKQMTDKTYFKNKLLGIAISFISIIIFFLLLGSFL